MVMAEPRRMSTRSKGDEPAKKKIKLTAPSPTAQTPPAKNPQFTSTEQKRPSVPSSTRRSSLGPVNTSPAEPRPIPSSLQDDEPLPTLPTPQAQKDLDESYQNIAQSRVLAEATDRSRQKWQSDAIFERYWTKPVRKKGVTETPQPPKESMTRLGNCTMCIDPHIFEITLYAVKKSSTTSSSSTVQPAKPPMGHNFQYPAFPPPQPVYNHYSPYPVNVPNKNSTSSHIRPLNTDVKSSSSELSNSNSSAVRQIPSSAPPLISQGSTSCAVAPRVHSTNQGSNHVQTKESIAGDPVIQMLATRAASDVRLKSLMKIVAAGNASPEQLKEFQGHIDELNEVIRASRPASIPAQSGPAPDINPHVGARNANDETNRTSTIQPPKRSPVIHASQQSNVHHDDASNPTPNIHQTSQETKLAEHRAMPLTPPVSSSRPLDSESQVASAKMSTTVKQESVPAYPLAHVPQAQPRIISPNNWQKPVNPYPSPSQSKHQNTSAVVFDFGGAGDRYKFPRMSILELQKNGTQVIASFLAISRAAAGGSASKLMRRKSLYASSKDYYQPVTLRLSSPTARVLEPLSHAVAGLDEVRSYMQGIFDKSTRANIVYLPLRLPRASRSEIEEKSNTVVAKQIKTTTPSILIHSSDKFSFTWGPPSSMMPVAA